MEYEWDIELSELDELAARAEQEHLPMAVDGNATSVAIVQSARMAVLLVKLLRGVRVPTAGDKRILQSKSERLHMLLRGGLDASFESTPSVSAAPAYAVV